MNVTRDRIIFLLNQCTTKAATAAELDELEAIADQLDSDAELREMVTEIVGAAEPVYPGDAIREMMLEKVFGEERLLRARNDGRLVRMVKRIAVAASILLVIGLGTAALVGVFTNKPEPEIVQTQEQRFKNDVDPGSYKARLTLADGKEIILDSVAVGELATQGNTRILNKEGQLVYQGSQLTANGSQLLYNTLSTARGEMYATVLADGSKVWLNSASSIKYPVAFVGTERKVEITGEAYFEIEKDAAKPFIVSVNGMDVQVLGTHFNINAYSDETSIKTTLLEGSVKVSKAGADIIIKPGQQAVLTHSLSRDGGSSQLTIQNSVDLEQVMAWKNGMFDCNGLDIGAIMRQVARWYNVDVKIEEGVTQDKFKGKIPRSVKLTSLLKILELSDVKFTLDGNKISVIK